MSDNKNQVKQDRKLVSAEQPYEINYFMNKHGLSRDDAEKIIKQAGNSRDKANDLAAKMKK